MGVENQTSNGLDLQYLCYRIAKFTAIMHNSYNAASNFSSSNGGFLNYLWKNTFNSSQQQQQQTKQQQSSSSSWRQNNSNSGQQQNNKSNSGNSGRKSG